MGWLSRLLGGAPEKSEEARLLDDYSNIFEKTGMNSSEAKKVAENLLDKAKQKVVQRGWSNQGTNTGDLLLQREKTDERVRGLMVLARTEGVQEDDMRWWWNMPPLERVMNELADEQHRVAAFIAARREGFSAEEAATKVKKIHPVYGDPREQNDEDRPLPIELKRRIVSFIEKQMLNPELMRERIEKTTSFNAIIREELRQGTYK